MVGIVFQTQTLSTKEQQDRAHAPHQAVITPFFCMPNSWNVTDKNHLETQKWCGTYKSLPLYSMMHLIHLKSVTCSLLGKIIIRRLSQSYNPVASRYLLHQVNTFFFFFLFSSKTQWSNVILWRVWLHISFKFEVHVVCIAKGWNTAVNALASRGKITNWALKKN